jgi:hypothetical protein
MSDDSKRVQLRLPANASNEDIGEAIAEYARGRGVGEVLVAATQPCPHCNEEIKVLVCERGSLLLRVRFVPRAKA